MNTYILILITSRGEVYRFVRKGSSTPYDTMDRLAKKLHADYVRCVIRNQGWFIEKDYPRG